MSAAGTIQDLPEAHVRLPDGTAAVIRRLTAADLDAVQRLHEHLPDHDLYLRFFGVSRRTARKAAHLVVGEGSVSVGLFRDGSLEGVASFRGADPPDVAVVVAHTAQHRGIGTLLLEALAAQAREHGIRVLSADVLATNSTMLAVLHDSGLTMTHEYDGPITHLLIDVPEQVEPAYAKALARRHDPRPGP